MRLGDSAFFNDFSRLAAATNPSHDCDEWHVAGVRWIRERHTYRGPNCAFQLETHTLRYDGSSRMHWSLLVATEIWWTADAKRAFRHGRWAHQISGARSNVTRWFSQQMAKLDAR